jgi:thioredoxin reductase (NADPH)
MYDVIIIGKGPAGISASLYTTRANLKTLIIGKDESALRKAAKIENYFGFAEPVSGEHLLQEGEKQAHKLGAYFLDEEVISIENKDAIFEVATSKGVYKGIALLIATGQPQKPVRLKNIKKFEGNGISYCSTCDGFFYKDLKVGVLGNKDYAIHEAMELTTYTQNITIYTNGKKFDLSEKFNKEASKFKFNEKAIEKVDGENFLQRIYFNDSTNEEIDGLFIANDSASSIDFARKLGVIARENSIVVDEYQMTNVEGLFAAGDCTGGFKQVSTAVGQGALAGKKISEYIRNQKKI